MHDADDLRPMLLDLGAKLVEIEHLAPGSVEPDDLGPGAFADLDEASSEEPLDAGEELVARLEQVDEARLHAGHAGRAVERSRR